MRLAFLYELSSNQVKRTGSKLNSFRGKYSEFKLNIIK